MPFAALKTIADRARLTAARFPLVLALAATAATLAVILIDAERPGKLGPALLAAVLGLAPATAGYLLGERLGFPARRRTLLAGAALPILIGFYLWAAQVPDNLAAIRFVHLALIGHLAVAVLPYSFGQAGRGFWQYNRILFERILLAAVYSMVLFVGLAVALLALDKLLGISIDDVTYPRLFAVIAFVFNTWFFLAGTPTDTHRLEGVDDYPQGLKVFSQYLLMPLVAVYLAILTLYLGRVIITRTWPSGWIGLLVSSVAVVGTLALLLIHPTRRKPEGRWVDGAARAFYAAMVPALVMALLAVGKRISQYGVTPPRYVLTVLASWLLLLSVFYVVSRSRSIRLIPASLGLVALATVVGPWGVIATSRRSQGQRFLGILASHQLPGSTALPDSGRALSALERRELRAVLDYLGTIHGPAAVGQLLGVTRDSATTWNGDRPAGIAGIERLGLEVVERDEEADSRQLQVAESTNGLATGFAVGDGSVFLSQMLMTPLRFAVGIDTISITPARADGLLLVTLGDSLLIEFDVGAVMDRAGPTSGRSETDPVVLRGQAGGFDIQIAIVYGTWPRRAADSLGRSVSGVVTIRRP